MKFTKLVCATALALSATVAHAEVLTFTPAGGSATVEQWQDLYWDMTSNATSTSYQGWVSDFNLSGHGDFHFWNANMVKNGTPDGGKNLSVGTLVGDMSNYGASYGYAGTDDYSGDCVRGSTCLYGLQFNLNGGTHYGWVKFSEGATQQSLHAWGYETVAGKSIAAGVTTDVPEPMSAALMGIGLFGMAALRRRKQSK